MKESLCIAFSGGRTSAMMTKILLDKYKHLYNFDIVFCNTGHEREATLEFVKKCDDEFGFNTTWIEAVTNNKKGTGVSAKIVTYETAYRNLLKNGVDPFEEVIKKHGITNQDYPTCTREMKTTAVRAYMRDIKGHKKIDYKVMLGIRTDEPKRLNWAKAKRDKLKYFAEILNVTKYDVNEFWTKQKFDLNLKSYQGNCILCWKKSDRKLFTIIQEGILSNDKELLAEIEWFKYIENKYGSFFPRGGSYNYEFMRFFRHRRSINDIIQESNFLDLSDYAKDESNILNLAKQMSMWDIELDGNAGCSESCEAF